MNGPIKTVGYILLLAFSFFFARGVAIMLWPYNPLKIYSLAVEDAGYDNTVTAGEKLSYVVHFQKNTNHTATIRRRLINSYVLPLAEGTGWNKLGEGRVMAQVQVPDFASEGIYRLQVEYTYNIGYLPTRTIIVTGLSQPFKIVKAPSLLGEVNAMRIRELKRELEEEKAIIRKHRSRSTYDPYDPKYQRDPFPMR